MASGGPNPPLALPILPVTRPLILLVDDDPGVRAAISFALEVEGFGIESFATAEAALAPPDKAFACAVLDYRLPGMDGLALLARLRIAGLPAIVVTSNASKQVHEQVVAMNAILIEKPLLGKAMVETIRSAAVTSAANDH